MKSPTPELPRLRAPHKNAFTPTLPAKYAVQGQTTKKYSAGHPHALRTHDIFATCRRQKNGTTDAEDGKEPMSSATRSSAYAVNGSAQEKAAPRPPRMSVHDSFKSERSDSRRHGPSPQSSTSHKRSASGNPRPSSRAVEERRTERVQVTTKETLVSRTRSPERRGAPSEKPRNSEGAKQRAPEARPKETRPEPAPPGNLQVFRPF